MPICTQMKLPLSGGRMYRRPKTEVLVADACTHENTPPCHMGQVCVKGGCDHSCNGQEQRMMYDLIGSDLIVPLFH